MDEAPESHAVPVRLPLADAHGELSRGPRWAVTLGARRWRVNGVGRPCLWTKVWTAWGRRGASLWTTGASAWGHGWGRPSHTAADLQERCPPPVEENSSPTFSASRRLGGPSSRRRPGASEPGGRPYAPVMDDPPLRRRSGARRRGAPQRPAASHGERLPRGRAHDRAAAGPHVQGRGGPLGGHDGRAARPLRPPPSALRPRSCSPRPRRCPAAYLGGRARPSSVRWVDNQRRPLGVVHPRRRHDPAVAPARGHAGLRRRLRPAPRARPPARARSRPAVLGPPRRLSGASSAPAATSTGSRPRPASGSPTTRPEPVSRPYACRDQRRAPTASVAGRQVVHARTTRTSIDSALTCGTPVAGVVATYCTSRWPLGADGAARRRVRVEQQRTVADQGRARRCRPPR